MRSKRISFTMDDRGYAELEHIGKAIGLKPNLAGRLAAYMFILSIKRQSIKLFLDDSTKLDEIGIEVLKQLSGEEVVSDNEVNTNSSK
jgi:trehalose/maltose hydrolase-like predicted phosphorylase